MKSNITLGDVQSPDWRAASPWRTRAWKRFVGSWQPVLLLLFRLRLGWLTDHWLMIITHIGRRTGKVYRTLVYVQHYNPATQEAMVVAAFGITDWYRNLCARPAPEVQIGATRYRPDQRVLETPEIAALERRFRRKHAVVARIQCWLMNWPWNCSETEFTEYAGSLRGIAFRPKRDPAVDRVDEKRASVCSR